MTAALPADRGHLTTERRHARSADLDLLDTDACVRLFIDDHRRVCDAAENAQNALAQFIDALVPRVRGGGRLIYLGAGTSGRLGVLDASECPPTFAVPVDRVIGIIAGGDSSLRRSSEGREDEPDGAAAALAALCLQPQDTVLGIAAGGTTPYVLGGLRLAKASGCISGLLTCAAPCEPPEHCDHLICLDTGPELLAGSTRMKAGSATKLALNVITTVLFVQLGKVYSNLMIDLRATNEKLRDRAIRILLDLCPGFQTRAAAAACLDRAGGELKVAVIMGRCGIDHEQASALLESHGGHLRPVLDGKRSEAAPPA